MLTIHPTPKQLDELRELRFRHPAPGAQRRAEIVLLVAHGALRRNDIAEILDVHINSVTNAVRRFMDNGVEGLLTVDNDAPDSELDAVNNLMRDQWSQHPPATVNHAAQQLEAATGIKRGRSSVARLLKRLGFRRRMAGSVPAKADPDIQAAFVENVMKSPLEAAERGVEDVYFMDASHFVFGAFLTYAWCLARIFIRTAAGRRRYNVLGAVNLCGRKLLTVTNETYTGVRFDL